MALENFVPHPVPPRVAAPGDPPRDEPQCLTLSTGLREFGAIVADQAGKGRTYWGEKVFKEQSIPTEEHQGTFSKTQQDQCRDDEVVDRA